MKNKIKLLFVFMLFVILPFINVNAEGYTVITGDYNTIGSVVKIEDEEFFIVGYVDTTHVKLLSKYNLQVGNGFSTPTKKQDASARGFLPGSSWIGTVPFGTTNDYSTSSIKTIVDEYTEYLVDEGKVTATGRLITKAEIEELVNNGDELGHPSNIMTLCDDAGMNWLYYSSYWLGTPIDDNDVFTIGTTSDLNTGSSGTTDVYGVRPLIILDISKTISFEKNNGSDIEEVKVRDGSKATKPEDPTKEGFVFVGWFTDEELTQEYDFDSSVTSNITLYAKYEEKEETTESNSTKNPKTNDYIIYYLGLLIVSVLVIKNIKRKA